MRGWGSGRQPAKQPVVWLAAGALIMLSFLFVNWWKADRLPQIFPPQLESLDQQVWSHGAEVYSLERYHAFHHDITDLRIQWRREQARWWPTADTHTLQATYQNLLQEGSTLLENSNHQKFTRHKQLTTALESERGQVTRLRALTGLFDVRRNLRALSVTEGLLNQAASRLGQDRDNHAHILLGQARESLLPVESQVMAQMERYGNVSQLAKWNLWVTNTLDWSSRTGGTVIVVLKASRQLVLYQNGKILRRFPIDLGFSGLQDKLQEGDGATPEGQFHILQKKGPGSTKFHKALLLNYPTNEHRRRFQEAKLKGRLAGHRSIGGLIEIHGQQPYGNSTTNGCIALHNTDMDAVFHLAKEGTPVTVVGALQPDNWVVKALGDITDHTRQRIVLPTNSLTVRNR
ncbi:L,D-transpeptidase [uncultured Nitrospira sp.]|uniref:L,D-transpeptidase family protein n=1 Tax=uncultured Nitrospira sp. TaxID=157176 RepID=UPI00314021CD